ncbi:bacteriohopanetetrol glucosamine biosynthesis glycosyltransferase HpnI [Candidatus Methylocalor cossyra]|uniref:Ceramide glucosyltransferase n=1 Tax=Candidatus Methylocalor cossyra TaxID=3108543 RepID=A0ABP1CBI6_9GAMM
MTLIGSVLALLAAGYGFVAWLAVSVIRPPRTQGCHRPPVSVLKPLCGAEPRLYENLRSFCAQDYPEFQLVCGVQEGDDPAIAVVHRLAREFPGLSLELVIDPSRHGSNHKVSNLINILGRCRYEHLVLADSDIAVGADYLAQVVAPLADPSVGVVTCLYRGRPTGGIWSRLGALFIDDWFAPSVRVAHAFGSRDFAFGATLALRRATLIAVGGFQAIADQLADDYWLGALTRRLGLRTVLSDYLVTTDVAETSLGALCAHELRWLRTIRSIQPIGFAFCFITFGLPVACTALLLAPSAPTVQVGAGLTLLFRLLLHLAQRQRAGGSRFSELWLVVPRDFLSFALWCTSFAGRRVLWGRRRLLVEADGLLRETA